MSFTILTVGPEAHIRVVAFALVASILVVWVSIVAFH